MAVHHGVEEGAELVNKGVGLVAGAWVGMVATHAVLAASIGAVTLSGAAALPVVLALGAGAIAGGAVGKFAGGKLSGFLGKLGEKLSTRLGFSKQLGQTAGKSALALGITAPLSVAVNAVTIGGAAIAGGLMLALGAAEKIAS